MDLVLITIACPRLLGVGLEKDGALLRAWLCLSIFIYLFINSSIPCHFWVLIQFNQCLLNIGFELNLSLFFWNLIRAVVLNLDDKTKCSSCSTILFYLIMV
jgi:hypothetical protein